MSRQLLLLTGFLLNLVFTPVLAKVLAVTDDHYGISFGKPLQVEATGVLENDTLDGEPAGENGATAELISNTTHGLLQCPTDNQLALCPDGSFDYTPGGSFPGSDSFTYQAVTGGQMSTATVTLSACSGGPEIYACWHESAYLSLLAQLGYANFGEGFEGSVWDIARSPDTAASVTSQGIVWTTNYPATNNITTGPGPARTGLYGAWDSQHGSATGTPGQCDVDMPAESCLYHDGLSGSLMPGLENLHGVGGYISGIGGSKMSIILDNTIDVVFGHLPHYQHQFIGLVDNSVAGFRSYEFREMDGKVGQAFYIWADDFTFATTSSATPPVAVTNAASSPGQTSATLNGTANPNGSTTNAWFEYGTSTAYGQTTSAVDVGNGSSPVAYNRPVSGLSCGGMAYHFRAVANSAGGTVYGSDRSFSTSACPGSNTAPVADAGTSQVVLAGDTVVLDGHLSSDVDEDPLTYHWSFVSLPAASNAVLDTTDPVYPGFITDAAGTYVVRLIVNDSMVDSAPDSVEIAAINSNGCSGDVVTISNMTIPIGITECMATTSITLGPDVVIMPGAELRLYSPSVSLGEGVTVVVGAILLVVPIP